MTSVDGAVFTLRENPAPVRLAAERPPFLFVPFRFVEPTLLD